MKPIVILCVVLLLFLVATGWNAAESGSSGDSEFRDKKSNRDQLTSGMDDWRPGWLEASKIEASRIHANCNLSQFTGVCPVCITSAGFLSESSEVRVGSQSDRVTFEIGGLEADVSFDALGPGDECKELRKDGEVISSPVCFEDRCPPFLSAGEDPVPLQVSSGGGLVRLRCAGSCNLHLDVRHE